MHDLTLALEGAWKVLAAGLVLGAGLPLVFALGVRSLALGAGGDAEVGADTAPNPVGRVLAVLCFGVVGLAVALGIAYVVATGFGHHLDLGHGFPRIT